MHSRSEAVISLTCLTRSLNYLTLVILSLTSPRGAIKLQLRAEAIYQFGSPFSAVRWAVKSKTAFHLLAQGEAFASFI